MKTIYHNDHIEFIRDVIIAPGFKPIPETFLKAYKLGDISEDIFKELTEDQTDSIYWFFFDLETEL